MNDSNSRIGFWGIAGVVLVVVGVWALLGDFLGPVMHVVGHIFWPVLLIGAGIALLLSAKGRPLVVPAKVRGTLYRSRNDRVLGGVIGGISAHLGIDSGLARALFVVFTILSGFGTGVLLYVVGMIFIAEEPVAATVVEPSAPSAPVADAL